MKAIGLYFFLTCLCSALLYLFLAAGLFQASPRIVLLCRAQQRHAGVRFVACVPILCLHAVAEFDLPDAHKPLFGLVNKVLTETSRVTVIIRRVAGAASPLIMNS